MACINNSSKGNCLVVLFFLLGVSVFSQRIVYLEDFNSTLDGWNFDTSSSSTGYWSHGSNSLHATDLSGDYIYSNAPGNGNKYKKNTNILATSPVISTVGYANLTFQFDVWYNTSGESNDGFQVQYSLNGSNWSVLGTPNSGSNWYNNWYIVTGGGGWSNNSGGWVTKSINLSNEDIGFDENPQVQFRIVFVTPSYSKPPQNSGVAFNNFLITALEPEYCTPENIEPYNTYFISNVSLGTINNTTSGKTGSYTDYSGDFEPANVFAGETLDGTISIDIDGWNIFTNYLNVWIDFNQDFAFNDTDEKFLVTVIDLNNVNGKKTVVVPISIPIPAGAALGTTRMRIGFIDDTHPNYTACNFVNNAGEVEDYSLNIIKGCSTNSWTGAVSSDWNNAANWDCGEVPTITTNVLIPVCVTNYPEIAADDAGGLANDIEIEKEATLTVFDNSLEINGTLLLNGIIHLDGEGQLIQNTGSVLDASSSGYLTLNQQGTANMYSYNYWGSPVGATKLSTNINISDYSYSLSDVLYSSYLTKVSYLGGNNYNGSAGPPIKIADYWIWKFANKPAGAYSEWQHVRSTGEIKAGEGFTMKGTTTGDVSTIQNYIFRGLPNNGEVSLTVTGGNEYLVANPFPSAIDGYQFINDNKPTNPEGSLLTGTLYFWQQFKGTSHNLADYEGGYATLNLSGGSPAASGTSIGDLPTDPSDLKVPGQYIPVAQGFFTNSDGDGGKIKFNNGQRYFVPESSGDAIFMKYSNAKTSTSSIAKAQKDTRPKFRLGFEAPQVSHRQLLLTIDKNTSDGVDWGYDGEMNGVVADDMFWALDNKKYVIQALPDANIDREIPLGIIMGKTGLATIKIDALENVDSSVDLYIKDALIGKTYKINNQPFEITLEAGTYTNRFSLTFAPQEVLDIEDQILEKGVLVFMDNTAGEIKIKNTIQAELLSVQLYNSLGQLQNTWDKNLQDQNLSLPVTKLATGMYLVQIKAATGVIAKKVIIE